jgi:P27 family predicted phage terminase small subunit
MKKSKSRAPAGLSVEARAWWRQLQAEFAIEDPGGLLLLQTALEAFDRLRGARALIDRDGVVITDRFGQSKPHPAATIERDARTAMLTALRALNLDVEPLQGRVGRPNGR